MKIYVLSLERSIERRARIAAALSGLGLPFQFFDAVDARLGLDAHAAQVDRPGILRRMRRSLSEGEIACALSHAAIYRDMIDAEHPHAIILEDDAILTPAFGRTVASGALEATGIDLIMFHHRSARVYRRPLDRRLPSGVRLFRLVKSATTTTGYYLTRRAALRLREASLPVSHTADWPIDLSEFGGAVCQPRLVEHPPEPASSTLAAGRIPEPRRSLREMIQPAYLSYVFRKKLVSRKIS
jgi:glycosyl transferase, family 25